MRVGIVIPYGGSCPFRKRALAWQIDYMTEQLPDAQISLGLDERQPFSYATACNAAVNALDPDIDILVLTGADSFVHPHALKQAIQMADQQPGYVRAFDCYRKANRAWTMASLDWQTLHQVPAGCVEWESAQAASPGVGALRRECYQQIGGYDERFQGWGYEDLAFMLTLEAHWPTRQVAGDLVHHWHPTSDTLANHQQSERNRRLYTQLYEPHAGNPTQLTAARHQEPA